MVEVLSACRDDADSFDHWRSYVRNVCGSVSVIAEGRSRGFQGTILKADVGRIGMCVVRSEAHTVVRSAGEPTGPRLYLSLVTGGEMCVRQDGRETVISAGELVTFDSARAYQLRMSDSFAMVAAAAPHEKLIISADLTRGITARTFSATEGVGAVLAGLLRDIGRHVAELDPPALRLLGDGLALTAAAFVVSSVRAQATEQQEGRAAMFLRVIAYARECLSDPELTPETLARAHHVSLRYLHKLFAENGLTPARWIKDERLARCRAQLEDPSLCHVAIALIGERNGLASASHFGRIFRQRYGMTPQDCRTMALRGHAETVRAAHPAEPERRWGVARPAPAEQRPLRVYGGSTTVPAVLLPQVHMSL